MRAASFGYGKKSDFTKSNKTDTEPALYRIDSLFDRNRSSAKGSSFGMGREFLKESSYIVHALAKHPGCNFTMIQGPGTYAADRS